MSVPELKATRKISASTRRFLAGVSSAAAVAANVEAPKQEVKLAVIGPLNAGKSALVVRYLTKRFIGDYDPNLEETYSKVNNNNPAVLIRVMDTSDQPGRDSCHRYLSWADCVILAASITSKSGFRHLPKYIEQWMEYNKDNVNANRRKSCDDVANNNDNKANNGNLDHHETVIRKKSAVVRTEVNNGTHHKSCLILTATKCDLHLDREVSRSEMESLADEYSVPLMETSSAEDIDSVEAVFRAAVKKALLLKEMPQQHQPSTTLLSRSRRSSPEPIQPLQPQQQQQQQQQGSAAFSFLQALDHNPLQRSRSKSPIPPPLPPMQNPGESSSPPRLSTSPSLSSFYVPPNSRKDSKDRFGALFKNKTLKGIFQ